MIPDLPIFCKPLQLKNVVKYFGIYIDLMVQTVWIKTEKAVKPCKWKKLLNILVFIMIKSPHGPNGLNQNGKGSQTLQKIIENQWGLSPAQILSLLHVEYTHFFYMVKLSDGKPQLRPTT